MDISKIKLIIWDLDDSFWKGTLSEGDVAPIEANIEIVKNLTKQGVVNSVCSKNDKEPAERRLREMGVADYFVFNSIDWTPKGQRIKQTLSDMGLRAVNTLFIDDNEVNLNEVAYYSEGILTLNPSSIEGTAVLHSLLLYSRQLPYKDEALKRLTQYQILERKREAKQQSSDNLRFLYSTNTQVNIYSDCINELDRLAELVVRTNQLNFTKNRMSKEDLKALLEDPLVESGYVTVKDNYGDYGIVGFYALKNNKAIHFLFSCRTIGQGVEQWVYSTLNYPIIDIVGETISELKHIEAPRWINQNNELTHSTSDSIKLEESKIIVFKGPCDLEMLTSYLNLDSRQVVTEYTYVSEENFGSIEHHNHSLNILGFHSLTKEEQTTLLNECYFNDSKVFSSKIFEKNVACVFLSTFVDPQLAIYRRKTDGFRVAFGDYNCDITDKENWNKIISEKFIGFPATEDDLIKFSDLYVYDGHLSAEETFSNLKLIFNQLSSHAFLFLTLGSEIKNSHNTIPVLEKREEYYKELNTKLRNWASVEKRVILLDFNDFVDSDSDYLDSINHFQRHIYYKAAIKMNELISNALGYELEKKSRFTVWYSKVFRPFLSSYFKKMPITRQVISHIKNKKKQKRYQLSD